MSASPCEKAIHLLWQYMDRELDQGAHQRLQEHLRECRECGSRHEFEERLRAIIQEKCIARRAPAALRRRVLALLQDL